MKNILPEMVEIADGDAGEAGRLARAMEAVAPRGVVLSESFNAALRARLGEADVGHARRQLIARLIGVAALVLLGIFLGGVMFGNRANPLGGSIAWADVVRAVKQVDHVHISAFVQEPHNAAAQKCIVWICIISTRGSGGGRVWITCSSRVRGRGRGFIR